MDPNLDSNDRRIGDLVTAYAILLNEQVLDSFGHVSVRSVTDAGHFFMPRAMPPSLVTAGDVLEYRVEDSQPVDQRGRRVNGERYLHGEIYKARPEVQAVIHSHSQAVIPFSLTNVPLRPVIVQAGFMPLDVPNFEIRDARPAGERGMQITDIPRGAALARTLGSGPVALLRGHGNVVVGTSIKQATVFAVYTDINARMQLAGLQIARDIVAMDEPELFGPSEFDINRPWENFRQKLLDDQTRAAVDRSQFGLAHTQPVRA
jgi:HCOMODA/2-hydroxy-3-carboxy-muconic semialdehyde decarboxylase